MLGVDKGQDELQVRELELREREYRLAEKKMRRSETEDAESADRGAFDDGLNISYHAGDVVVDLSMMRSAGEHT